MTRLMDEHRYAEWLALFTDEAVYWILSNHDDVDRTRFKNHVEARLAVFDFIEGWYNPHRRHSSIEYFSPINYERRQIAS